MGGSVLGRRGVRAHRLAEEVLVGNRAEWRWCTHVRVRRMTEMHAFRRYYDDGCPFRTVRDREDRQRVVADRVRDANANRFVQMKSRLPAWPSVHAPHDSAVQGPCAVVSW